MRRHGSVSAVLVWGTLPRSGTGVMRETEARPGGRREYIHNGMDPSPHLNGVTECASMRDVKSS
jgi:hypothetical protein